MQLTAAATASTASTALVSSSSSSNNNNVHHVMTASAVSDDDDDDDALSCSLECATSSEPQPSSSPPLEEEPARQLGKLRDSLGDFGLALFAPLLNLQENSNRDSIMASSSPNNNNNNNKQVALITPTTEKSASNLTLQTEEADSDQYRSDEEEEEEEPCCRLHIVPEPAPRLRACPRILTPANMEQLREHLPRPLRDHRWERCFAIGLHGDSFISLLRACAPHPHTVVAFRTAAGAVLGGFASERWRVQPDDRRNAYYGTGQSFVFASHPAVGGGAEQTEEGSSSSNGDELSVFKWTGSNDYCQICDSERRVLCMGGVGDFGWIVADDFSVGQTGPCGTFGNPPLAPTQHFEIADFEVYGLAPPLFGSTPSRDGSLSPLFFSTPHTAASILPKPGFF